MMQTTYILQGFSVVLMVLSAWLVYRCARSGQVFLGTLNIVFFTINLALFLWQAHIRAALS